MEAEEQEAGHSNLEAEGDGTTSAASFRLPPSASPSPNIKVGAARADEADAVLRVMCAAFQLPFDVARPIFYADPYFDLDAKRVLRVDGHIVSCLTLSETLCRVGAGYVPITGIAGLATLPAFQNRGYAALLLDATVQTLRERHAPLVGLYPFQAGYYKRLGWETAMRDCRCVVAPLSLPAYPEAANVINAEPTCLPAIARLYEQSLGLRCLSGRRDAKRWQYVFDRTKDRWIYRQDDGVTGYLFCETQPGTLDVRSGQTQSPPTLRVLEICATTPEARRGLLGHLRGRTAWGRIEYVSTPPALRDAGLLDLSPGHDRQFAIPEIEPSSALMLRVVDFPILLACLRPNWRDFEGEIALTLTEEQRPGASVTVIVKGHADALPTLSVQQSADSPQNADAPPCSPRPPDTTAHLAGDARQWMKAAVGYTDGADAQTHTILRASCPRAVQYAESLFPPRTPFLPALDHF